LIGFNCLAENSFKFFQDCTLTEKQINGEDLTNWKDMHDSTSCLSYVKGFRDALQMSNKLGVKTICLNRFTTGQIIMIILKFARENPDQLSEPRGFLLYYALSKYKC
jgi:hypothetical protein